MEKEIDGGEFTKKEEKPEGENQFITGDPSMITTDEVFALLGEQVVKAKNWAKIALTWNRNFNTLKQSTSQRELQIASISKQSQELKESNSKYLIINQTLDKRITELNLQIKEKDFANSLQEKAYKEIETINNSLDTENKSLTKDNEKLISIIKENEKEKANLKEIFAAGKKKGKKPKR